MKRRKAGNNYHSSSNEEDEGNVSNYRFGAAETVPCLQRELKQMSAASRELAGQDVHGVAERIDIPFERLEELQEQIDNLEDKAAYDLALEMSSEYVTSPEFRMAFLRSVDGSVKQAAKRVTRHFQTKLDLFGEDKLVKNIELSDFDVYDLEALHSGGFQVLPVKDRAGRPILFGRYTCMRYREIKNMVRGKKLGEV
jgi:hypothetical protein